MATKQSKTTYDDLLESFVRLENDIAANSTDTIWVNHGETASERIYAILVAAGDTDRVKRLSIYQGEEL